MKRMAVWAFYAVGLLAIGYLALYAYGMYSGRQLEPGQPIRIFRKPDAPDFSGTAPDRAAAGYQPWSRTALSVAGLSSTTVLPRTPCQTA
jgi:hypothetical protein